MQASPLENIQTRQNPAARQRRHSDPTEKMSRALKSLAHPLRLALLDALGDREMSTKELQRQVGSTQQNVLQHLGILYDGGWIARRRIGPSYIYRANTAGTAEVYELIKDIVY